jgi:TctA family transporter
MKKHIIGSLIATVMIYLCSSFIQWNMNPGLWPFEFRQTIIFAYGFSMFITNMLIGMHSSLTAK